MRVTCANCGVTIISTDKRHPVSCACLSAQTRITVAGTMVAFGPKAEWTDLTPTDNLNINPRPEAQDATLR